ncbi:MAG: hypothetical protein SOZ78_00490 [Eubacteriales bacterium]|nr:hypothetical protein [Eubacteriales bacterium]
MEEILYLEFGKSRSAKLKKAIRLCKRLSNYKEINEIHSILITDIKEYLVNQDAINELIQIVKSWKSTKIRLLGHSYKSSLDYYEFLYKLKTKAGKYAAILENTDKISAGAVTIESLPLPFVFYPGLYGTFFAFADDIDGQAYFCECEREALENYIRLKNIKDQKFFDENIGHLLRFGIPSKAFDSLGAFQFKKGICFRCNKKVPKKTYCHQMYGGQFKQHYGWYINQEYYKLGIDKDLIGHMNVLPEICTPEVYDAVQRINNLIDSKKSPNENYNNEIIKFRNGIDRAIENSVREQLGFKKIGDAWVSETLLYNIIQGLYPKEKILRHYRPQWLEGLELDVFIPSLKLGFEYQGIQHFKAITHWGGQAQLEKQQRHDKKKKDLCDALGVRLICVDYDEPLNSEYIVSRIKSTV